MKRHPHNSNLHLHSENSFHHTPVYTNRGPNIEQYLERLELVINTTLQDYSRVFAFRVDLHCPPWYIHQNENHANAALERFFASLKAQIEHNRFQALQNNPQAHCTKVRFVWAREFGLDGSHHFHVLILLNYDAFNCLGDFTLGRSNLYNRVVKAWSSALRGSASEVVTLVHFPENPMYWLYRGNTTSYQALFYRASYLCKADTKQYPDQGHAFGYSRY